MARPKNPEIREFVLRNVSEHASDIAPYAAMTLGVTRASVSGYLRALIDEGLLEASGKTKARRYQLRTLDYVQTELNLDEKKQEDVIWRDQFFQHVTVLPENIMRICEYGFLEMLNNAIEHSEGKKCYVLFSRNYVRVLIYIIDDGVGIFDKITRECNLSDNHEAILELSKGKLTTDQTRHTGEGIFFTSRMFDRFEISSGALAYIRRRTNDDDWLIDVEAKPDVKGTSIYMEISASASQTMKEVFDKYVDDDARFSKTIVPLKLAKYEGEHLVSRSQARRIMARVERFSEVWLDFDGVADIGQPFADEIFRVWAKAHSHINLRPFNFTDDVEKMIRHARENATEDGAPEQPSSDSERSAKP
ncbi:MAG: DUF4325 domain-containing protein [Rhizomicrobium sp.]